MKKKNFLNLKCEKKNKKESNNRIEHNILSRIEKILKKFFVYLAFFFYFHKYCSTLTTISDKITVEL